MRENISLKMFISVIRQGLNDQLERELQASGRESESRESGKASDRQDQESGNACWEA